MLTIPDRELPEQGAERARLAQLADSLGVPMANVRLAGSMADYVQHALATTPRLQAPAHQEALTNRHLSGRLESLHSLFLELRAAVDPELRGFARGRPYPLGRCLEITVLVLKQLDDGFFDQLSPAARDGLAALNQFRETGGEVRRVWGDLRGRYFQNALQVGVLYVDVANDTVVASKPPVEILPFAQSGLRAIADHLHFARIAHGYWSSRFLPNHVVPELAPWLPLVEIRADGRIRLGSTDAYMLGLALSSRFRSSEAAVAASSMPEPVFEALAAVLRDGPVPIPSNAAAGRTDALEGCRAARDQGLESSAAAFNRAIVAGSEVNRRLAGLRAVGGAQAPQRTASSHGCRFSASARASA